MQEIPGEWLRRRNHATFRGEVSREEEFPIAVKRGSTRSWYFRPTLHNAQVIVAIELSVA